MENSADSVEILMGEVTEEKHPVDGHMMYRRKDVMKPEKMPDYGTFKAPEPERVPSAYYVPASLTQAIDNLKAHGMVMTPLKSAQTVQVEEFRIQTNERGASAAFESQRADAHRRVGPGGTGTAGRDAAGRAEAAARPASPSI